jgi:aldehyde dehydrogenase (NAD+)
MTRTPEISPAASGALPSIGQAFAAQRQAAIALRTSTAEMRIAKLRKLEAAVLSNKAGIYRALAADLGKSEAEADLFDILPVISGIRHACRNLKSWMKPQRVPPTMTMIGTKAWIVHEPRGASLIIAPWNYPVSLLLGPLISAIAAGCTAILKPSEISEATSRVMTKIIRETFDWQEAAVFEGDADVSKALFELPFEHIFFTGSPAVGKAVMAAAAKHLASVTLELGGKSPVIVDESANIAKAAARIAWGKFSNCGQTCVAPDYAYVHESRLPQFIDAMKASIRRKYGDAAHSPDYCRIINARHFQRISRLIDDAADRGARIVTGGERDAEQNFIAPTLLTGMNDDALVMQEEIFGPILPVLPYRDLAEPIAAINARPKPLALYVYTRDQARATRVLRETSAGGSCINASVVHFVHHNLPFGGVGNSGMGKAHGFYGFRAFSHERAVLEDKFSVLPLFFPPYTERVKRLIKWTVQYLS